MSQQPAASAKMRQPSVLGSPAADEAASGIVAGLCSTVCMQPLDLLKVKFQVSQSRDSGSFGQIAKGMQAIVRQDGYRGLYRGLNVNLVGNGASWGAYFWWYTMIKARKAGKDPSKRLSAPQHLAASVEAGVYSAVATNPLWVVKTRMFTTRAEAQGAYRGVLHGLWTIGKTEGIPGLWKGTTLALIGISNGAIQFMTYEHLKRWAKDRKRMLRGESNPAGEVDLEPLSDLETTAMSGTAKMLALGITYPYQVIRSRIQNLSSIPEQQYKSIPDCVKKTYQREGAKAFYNGLGTNLVRILPNTCVTFVVYERCSSFFSTMARQQQQAQAQSLPP